VLKGKGKRYELFVRVCSLWKIHLIVVLAYVSVVSVVLMEDAQGFHTVDLFCLFKDFASLKTVLRGKAERKHVGKYS
jgi:hypothetical protein